jgi:hypothetical protein
MTADGKVKLLAVILGLSLAVNGYFLLDFSSEEPVITDVSAACDNSQRFPEPPKKGGGEQITEDTANAYITKWLDSKQPLNHVYISKIAIDSIFASNLQLNGLKIAAAFKPDGTPTMIATGVTKKNYAVTLLEDPIKYYFMADDVCPNNCH